MQREAARLGEIVELVAQTIEQIADGKGHGLSLDDARLDLVDVEQGVQHARHGAERLFEARNQLLGFFAFDRLGQQLLQQRQRLQRLAQVMAGGSQETRLGDIRTIGFELRCL